VNVEKPAFLVHEMRDALTSATVALHMIKKGAVGFGEKKVWYVWRNSCETLCKKFKPYLRLLLIQKIESSFTLAGVVKKSVYKTRSEKS